MGCNQSNTAGVQEEISGFPLRSAFRDVDVVDSSNSIPSNSAGESHRRILISTSNILNFDQIEIERRSQFLDEFTRIDEQRRREERRPPLHPLSISRRREERRPPLHPLSISRSRSREQFENADGNIAPHFLTRNNLRASFNWGQPITLEDELWFQQSQRQRAQDRSHRYLRDHESHPPPVVSTPVPNVHELFSEFSVMSNVRNVDTSGNDSLSPSYFPPASPQAIHKLPIISMASHHFHNDQNKECSICFQEFSLGNRVVRLPCGHMFHRTCIKKWLKQKCTCPVCRWEIETNDPFFELGRIPRMKKRQIRLHSFDLECMTIDELLGLAEIHANKKTLNSSSIMKKKKNEETFRSHLINEIKNSNQVHVIEEEKSPSECDICTILSNEER